MASKIGVCGELIGGSLATMLALTECRAQRPTIDAAAAGNPIGDWTAIFAADSGDNTDALSETSLLKIRDQLFSKPEHFHDPFASPLLFFRTPSTSLPNPYSQQTSDPSLEPAPDPYALGEDIPSAPDRLRRSHRKYPPAGSLLRLPHTRIEIGQQSGLRQQGEDLAEQLVKSVKYWEEETYGTVGQEALRERVEIFERDGLGLWTERELVEIGSWFGEVLRR